MQSTAITFRQLSFSESKTYILTALFIIGNIALPQMFHLIPNGGITWLPIYFFTLVGAFTCGWRVGIMTALLSPVVNSLLFGMPPVALLPAIMLKSTTLALCASLAAQRFQKASLLVLAGVVLSYQLIGGAGEWIITGKFSAACQDFSIGVPGMLLQVFGGWLIINKLIQKK